jgi:hypothetical protein
VETKLIELNTGEIIKDVSENLSINFIGTTPVSQIKLDEINCINPRIAIITLFDSQNNIVHRNYYLEKKWKHVKLAGGDLSYHYTEKGVIVTAGKPAYFMDVYFPGILTAERGIILLPGEEYKITIDKKSESFDEPGLKLYCLNNYLPN